MNYNEWLDIDVLEDYLDGKLDAKTMHKVERLSLEDPFVAEALAGLSQSPKRTQSLSLLQKQLQERIAQKPIEKKRWAITSQRLSIAAAAAVLFITVSVLFWMKQNNIQKMGEDQQAKNTDVKIAPQVAKESAPVVAKADSQISTVIDKAFVEAKSNSYAKNKDIPAAVATESIVAPVPEKTMMRSATVTPAPAQPVLVEEEIRVNNPNAKRNATDVQVLSSRAKGVTYSAGTYTGKVVSQINGVPIAGALVKLQGANLAATTDRGGEFKLSAEKEIANPKLSVSYLGFAEKEVSAEKNKKLEVSLAPTSSALSEVTISANQSVAKDSLNGTLASKFLPTPAGGKDAFDQYLKDNNKLFKGSVSSKAVTLSFEIATDGAPTAIKVIKGLSNAENEEAVRLLKNGPKWLIPTTGAKSALVTIKF